MRSWLTRMGCAAGSLLAALALGQTAQEFQPPQVRLPFMTSVPAIDGVVDDQEWAGAARFERFCGVRSPLLSGGEASSWVGCDGTRLLVAVRSETAPGGKLLARVAPAPQDGDARVWLDDSVELVFDALRTAPEARRRLHHAIINAKGAIYDQRHTLKGGGEAWRGHWQVASSVVGDRWHFELTLPLADLEVTTADLIQPFGVRVCRNWLWAQGPQQTEWSPAGSAFLAAETMPLVTWDPAAPVVQMLQLQDPVTRAPHLRVSIRNPQPQPLEVQALIQCRPQSSAPAERRETLRLGPGATRILELAFSLPPSDPTYTLVQVTSADGQTVYHRRDFRWQLERPEPFFVVDQEDAKRLGVDFAYYPYHDTAKVRVDISGMQDKDRVSGVNLAIRNRADGRSVATTTMPPLREQRTQLEWRCPSLPEGEYELVVSLTGVQTEPVVTRFVRHVFPWEHNAIGKSPGLIPPFTAITVEGRRLSTVLRTHTLDSVCLWEQVESQGVPLLHQPMRLEATVAGKRLALRGDGPRFTEQTETRVVAISNWAAGALSGTAASEWDIDGLMKWSLTLEPGPEPLADLTLTIPLDNASCPLMHACTDGIRFNYAGSVPAGEGRVWDGSKAARNSLLGSYVPYLWVGEEGRGLCVFGENDRGWVTDAQVPCQELVRRGPTLELVLHLVAKPLAADAPRRLVIGFQATPVKPMPPDWRLWSFGAWRSAAIPGLTRYIAFLGSCWYWGTETPCLDYYPRGGDMTYLRQLAETRRTGEIDRAYVDEWLKGFEPIYAEAKTPEARKETENCFRAHTECAFRTVQAKPQYLNIYTNGRGVRFDTPEGQTFLDEWYREAFAKRTWPPRGGVAYDLDPVESFRDYAVWYFRQMAEIVVDSIYWDDLFLQSNFDTVGTDAYGLPSGYIQPSTGLFAMREYVRRTARLFLEMGRPVHNIVHMTNTAIVPVLAFAQMNYTWEDKGGATDFQDRFSRDYIRAESLGLQQGNVPFALWLVHGADQAQLDWVERTGTGVMLVHEIKTSGGGELFWKTYARMVEYGYGRPEVSVSQYWQKQHPARVEGTDAATLVLAKPGSAMVLVCDYGDGGELALTLDRQALALPDTLDAVDTESGQPLETTADGKVRFALKKHDFRLIQVAAKTP